MTRDSTRRPLRVNGKPIPRDIVNGLPGDFARFCGETDPAVLALLDAEGLSESRHQPESAGGTRESATE